MAPIIRTVRAPGRVNLIGDHTDYTGGLVLPMAINLATTLRCELTLGPATDIQSANVDDNTERYISAVGAELREAGRDVPGIRAELSTTIPVGAGLSSSAAFETALALAYGAPCSTLDERVALAKLLQRAEQRAVGVPCGIMDQLICLIGRKDHAAIIDCDTLDLTYVRLPDGIDIVVRFVAKRTLAGSEYADRVAQCAHAEQSIGPLRLATIDAALSIKDATVRKRARHVISENNRVREFAVALSSGDLTSAGRLMFDSHRSLATDFDVSTPQMDAVVDEMRRTPGVIGARMTGGGFGGCVVAIVEKGVDIMGWRVSADDGASVSE
jgi:galactokinase